MIGHGRSAFPHVSDNHAALSRSGQGAGVRAGRGPGGPGAETELEGPGNRETWQKAVCLGAN